MNVLSLGASVAVDATALNGSSSAMGGAQFELRVGMFLKNELQVVSFEGREHLNRPYEYDVVFDSSVPIAALQMGVFGFPACLSIQVANHDPRVIQGLAVGFEAIGAAESDLKTTTRRYMMRIVPRLWLLNHNRQYRVFQDKTAIQIACVVLEQAGIKPTIRLQKEKYPPIPFMYQRGETDLEFLHHVLAVAGVFYYFAHASGFLEELMPGAGELGALAGGLGGMASGAADLTGGFSAGAEGASVGGGLAGALGGGPGSAPGGAAGLVQSAASAVGAATTMVLCDRARHTHALQDASVAATAGAAVSAGLGALGGAVGGAFGAVANVAADVVSTVTQGLGDTIPFDGNGQAATASERIFSFRVRTEVRPKSVTVREWNLVESKPVRFVERSSTATLDVDAGISAAVSLAGRGFSAGLTADLNVDALPVATTDVSVTEYQRDAATLAARRASSYAEHALSQLRGDRITGTGASDCRRLAPGYRFQVALHPIDPVNTEYVVAAVRSTGYAIDHLPAGYPHLYHSTFDCVPASVDPRPPKPAPRPPLGLESAIVVGPVWGDVNCDSLGRIQVRFRWTDASADYDPNAEGTCWIHWLERWAGNGYGTMTFPRVGSEVLVDFLQGEGGRPIAVGQLYSAETPPPFALPRGTTRVGIRSQAIPPGTGYSEIAIEDAKGRQEMHLRAEGCLDVKVTADHASAIDGNSVSMIGGERSETVVGALRTSVGGERVESVSSSAITEIGQDLVTRVRGQTRLELAGVYSVTASGDETRTTGGALEARVGQSATHSYASDTRYTVGHPDRDAQLVGYVYGTSTLKTTKEILLASDASITLKCGDTLVVLTPDGLTIGGKKISQTASSDIQLVAPNASLALDDNAALIGKGATVSSSGASLALKSDAKLSGSAIKLGSGSGTSNSASAQQKKADDKDKPTHIRVKLMRLGKPAAGVPYTLKLDDTLELSGSTTGDGLIEQQIPPTIATALLTFPDTGEKRVLTLRAIDPVDTVSGAQYRLKHLGFYRGTVDGAKRALTTHALEVFQKAVGLPTSGELDSATQGALKKEYGS